jgi:hypothetical protein
MCLYLLVSKAILDIVATLFRQSGWLKLAGEILRMPNEAARRKGTRHVGCYAIWTLTGSDIRCLICPFTVTFTFSPLTARLKTTSAAAVRLRPYTHHFVPAHPL